MLWKSRVRISGTPIHRHYFDVRSCQYKLMGRYAKSFWCGVATLRAYHKHVTWLRCAWKGDLKIFGAGTTRRPGGIKVVFFLLLRSHDDCWKHSFLLNGIILKDSESDNSHTVACYISVTSWSKGVVDFFRNILHHWTSITLLTSSRSSAPFDSNFALKLLHNNLIWENCWNLWSTLDFLIALLHSIRH